MLNGEKPKTFPLRSGTRQVCLLSPLLFNIVLEVLATAIRTSQSKTTKPGRSKTVTIADEMVLYVENPNDSTKKLLE